MEERKKNERRRHGQSRAKKAEGIFEKRQDKTRTEQKRENKTEESRDTRNAGGRSLSNSARKKERRERHPWVA